MAGEAILIQYGFDILGVSGTVHAPAVAPVSRGSAQRIGFVAAAGNACNNQDKADSEHCESYHLLLVAVGDYATGPEARKAQTNIFLEKLRIVNPSAINVIKAWRLTFFMELRIFKTFPMFVSGGPKPPWFK
jgi:hypothetical protein